MKRPIEAAAALRESFDAVRDFCTLPVEDDVPPALLQRLKSVLERDHEIAGMATDAVDEILNPKGFKTNQTPDLALIGRTFQMWLGKCLGETASLRGAFDCMELGIYQPQVPSRRKAAKPMSRLVLGPNTVVDGRVVARSTTNPPQRSI